MSRPITSPSNFFRRLPIELGGCPGSEQAELGAPEGDESKAAQLGTLAHYHDANPDEEVEQVSMEEILKWNQDLREKYISHICARLGIPENAKRRDFVEETYYFRDENGNIVIGVDGKEMGGHPDRLVWFPEYRVLFVFDFKSGRKPVPSAESNYQLRLYSIYTADPDHGDFDAEKVFAAITQPLASPRIHAVEYDKPALRAAKAECLSILRSLRKPNQPRNPTPHNCGFCRAKPSCFAVIALKKKLAEQKISELPIPELEALAPKMEIMQGLIDSYWSRIKCIAENYPDALQTMALKDGANVMEISAEKSAEAYVKLAEAGLLDAKEFSSAAKPSITKLTNIIAKKHKITVKEARLKLEMTLGETAVFKQKSPTIVDKSPALIAAPEATPIPEKGVMSRPTYEASAEVTFNGGDVEVLIEFGHWPGAKGSVDKWGQKESPDDEPDIEIVGITVVLGEERFEAELKQFSKADQEIIQSACWQELESQ